MDLKVGEGEFVVVMGASGAGKSTLCVSLNGLIPNFLRGRMDGEVWIRDRSTREGKVGEFAQEVGLVFQDFEAQLFSTNVELEVAFGPENFQVEHEEMVRRVREVLERVRLDGFEGRSRRPFPVGRSSASPSVGAGDGAAHTVPGRAYHGPRPIGNTGGVRDR